jgi:hypothetical protein
MRRLLDVLIATALVLIPTLATFASSAPSATLAQAHHYTALKVTTNSAAGPGDPGTL